MVTFLLLTLTLLFSTSLSSIHSSCELTFCKRIRNGPQKPRNVILDFATSLEIGDKSISTNLNINDSPSLKFHLEIVEDSVVHLLIDEIRSTRYRATDALVEKLAVSVIEAVKSSETLVTVTDGNIKVLIYSIPFKIEIYNKDNNLLSIVNLKNNLIFERRPNYQETAIALDLSFFDVNNAYGLPLHQENLLLRTTETTEPYRLFNNVNTFRTYSTTGMHGSVPVLYAHGSKHSSGIFWLNPSQTWVDVKIGPNQVDSYFMSETGAMELFILTGPTLPEVVTQYSKLTGVAQLPPYFALGYHQSRYSLSQFEVVDSIDKFNSSDLPLDAIWLNAEYTDSNKYFTWHPKGFENPYEMLQYLDKNHQKLLIVINPHLKNDDNYAIHVTARREGYYVRNHESNSAYSAMCLPGLSSWLDFLNPKVRRFYIEQFQNLDAFEHPNLHIWNDMNEPVVYSTSNENTLPGNVLCYQSVTYSEIRNMYGFYQIKATQSALLGKARKVRPFVFTSAHFAGSQRYAAVSTGNNEAEWSDLRLSLPMCLTEALAGISFCGADVGGYRRTHDDELYVRRYQAGAWLPLFRGRYELNAPIKEPYEHKDEVKDKIRKALRQRYSHIPLWYLLFRQHEITGEPVIRPITYHYPKETEAFAIDDEILVGSDVLVAPVLEPLAIQRSVYLPGGNSTIWYNIDEGYKKYYGSGYQIIPVDVNSVPVFYRGGSIIPRKDTKSNSAGKLCKDKYTIYISPDVSGSASGSLYEDHCDYFYYKTNLRFLYLNLTYNNNTLTVSTDGWYPEATQLERIVLLDPPKGIAVAKVSMSYTKDQTFRVSYQNEENALEIDLDRKALDLNKHFTVELLSNSIVFKVNILMLIFIIFGIMLI